MSFEQMGKNSEFEGKSRGKKKKSKKYEGDDERRSRKPKKAPREKNRDWRDFLMEEEDEEELIG